MQSTIVCGSCAASVPYGRLSCPSCGELLASVAGARRGGAAALAARGTATLPGILYDADRAPVVDVDGELETGGHDEAPPPSWAGNGTYGDETADDVDTDELQGSLDDERDAAAATHDAGASSTTGGPAWAVAGSSLTGPATPSYMPRPNRGRETAAPSAVTPAAAVPMPAAPSAPALPGAYLPPVPAASMPAGPAGPARAWVGHGADGETALDAAKTNRAGNALSDIDPSRLAEFVGSVSIAGAALAAVGFLLPWASVVIGSTGTGYFDRWGLAGPGHIAVVLGTLAILALAIVKNPIPAWIRTGIAGVGIGALLLGLAWPYLLNPALEAAPGVLIEAVGALALIVAGVLALVADRHVGAPQDV